LSIILLVLVCARAASGGRCRSLAKIRGRFCSSRKRAGRGERIEGLEESAIIRQHLCSARRRAPDCGHLPRLCRRRRLRPVPPSTSRSPLTQSLKLNTRKAGRHTRKACAH
jgi:hypothetical protein